MKKTAVLIYNQFCNFEIAPALEMLAISQKPFTVFAKTLEPVKSEEGLVVLPQKTVDDMNIEEYDSLILPGAMDIRDVIEDDRIISFIKQFDGMPVGAISIAPLLLLKAGLLKDKAFMAGVNREELAEEGYTADEMKLMTGWNDNLKNPIEQGYIVSDNIVTSVSYNFLRWTLAFGELIGIKLSPKTFGL
ncbi:MAG: DJ-1/PfpI family protein [Oscillospiraceae bacterium]|nr:DJ-1/PfpI family protein [Oscillospiraceae bacterium]